VIDSKEFVAIAITEDGAGSDMHGIETHAIPTTDGYFLFGEKMYVARLSQASKIIIFANVLRSEKDKLLTAFLVPSNLPGLNSKRIDSLGLNGVSFGSLHLNNVFVPSSLRIGGEGQGFSLFTKHFTYWRTAMAAAAIGCARGAIEQSINRLQTRKAFGGPIGRFTHLQQQLAEHTARLHMAWLLVLSVMDRIDSRLPAFADAAMAKAEAVEVALSAVDWCMRVYAAKGYSTQVDIEKRFRDLLGLRIADGTTDVLRTQVARAILGNDLYEMALGRSENNRSSDTHINRRFW